MASKKKPKPRGGPRTVKLKKDPVKLKPHPRQVEDVSEPGHEIHIPDGDLYLDSPLVIPPDAKFIVGPETTLVVHPSPPPPDDAPLVITQPEKGHPFSPAPAPWDCKCGPARNSALVDECPVCKTKRPYEYTAPEPVLAVPSDYPQPGESMEDYAKRMRAKPIEPLGDQASVDEGRRIAQEVLGVDPGRARELPDITSGPVEAKGYASPFQFAGPVGSVDVDPLILQHVLDVANKAALTGQVMSVTIGLKNPSQARCIIRYDLDVASVPWPRGVKDDG